MFNKVNWKMPWEGNELRIENMEYFSSLSSMITNNAILTRENKSRIASAKAAFNRRKTFATSKMEFSFRKKPVKCYILGIP
jgi:hypothetical protein